MQAVKAAGIKNRILINSKYVDYSAVTALRLNKGRSIINHI